MSRHKRTRGLAAYQRARRLEKLNADLHEIAVLEGRLMGRLGVDLEALRARVFGGEILDPSERLGRLLSEAAAVGV